MGIGALGKFGDSITSKELLTRYKQPQFEQALSLLLQNQKKAHYSRIVLMCLHCCYVEVLC